MCFAVGETDARAEPKDPRRMRRRPALGRAGWLCCAVLWCAVLCNAAAASAARRVVVLGGSGRVGGSTAAWIYRLARREGLDLSLAIAGRERGNYDRSIARLGLPADEVEFVRADVDGPFEALVSAFEGSALVVHTAGPFQGRTRPDVLRAALAARAAYVDVCDEWPLARTAREELSAGAAEAGSAAVVCAGIWPGVSALMAAEAVSRLGDEIESLDFSFFTAGSGNAGPTIVSATFLLLAQAALTLDAGAIAEREPWTDDRVADFGPGVGERRCWLLDNPDVPTCHASLPALRGASVASRFGTSPGAWNYLFGGFKTLVPRDLLSDADAMMNVAKFSTPVIRAVDALVGATNAMRVDAVGSGGKRVTLRVAHDDLEMCVGLATAAFAAELLRGDSVRPGVWYPAELEPDARARILERVREGAIVWDV